MRWFVWTSRMKRKFNLTSYIFVWKWCLLKKIYFHSRQIKSGKEKVQTIFKYCTIISGISIWNDCLIFKANFYRSQRDINVGLIIHLRAGLLPKIIFRFPAPKNTIRSNLYQTNTVCVCRVAHYWSHNISHIFKKCGIDFPLVKPNCKYKIHGFTNLKIDETSIAWEESNSLDLCNSKFLSIFYRSLKNWK